MNTYNKLRVVLIILMTISILLGAYMTLKDSKEEDTDNIKFSKEYPKVNNNNMFKYRTLKEANNLIENGSGYFFFCNKDNNNCENYALYLYEEADDVSLKTIYYIDIKEDIEKGTNEYKKLKELLKDKIDIIEYPLSVIVNNKKIIGTNIVKDKSYWNDKTIEEFKIEIMGYMNQISSNMCDEECKD